MASEAKSKIPDPAEHPQSCATVTDARVLDRYRVELTFSDGVRASLDLTNRIVGRGGVFAPLEDLHFFQQARVNSELGTVEWPNGADFCPDLLYHWAKGEAVLEPNNECRCCTKGSPKIGKRVCPECQHVFQGKGWDGIDAHWRAKHEQMMSYESFWASLCDAHRKE
jgi:hypothetical protein